MCVKLNLSFDSKMKVDYVTQVVKQGFKIKRICPNYILELHLYQVYIGEWAEIEIVIENHDF